jgi:hypothetical protein
MCSSVTECRDTMVQSIWVELKRTPIGLHPNCKKNLKTGLRLTQDSTRSHGFLRWGLTRPNDVSKE